MRQRKKKEDTFAFDALPRTIPIEIEDEEDLEAALELVRVLSP